MTCMVISLSTDSDKNNESVTVFGLGVFSMARRHALVSLRHAASPSAMLPLFLFFIFFLGLILL